MKKILFLFDDVSLAAKRANPSDLVEHFNKAAEGKAEYRFSRYSDLGFFLAGKKAAVLDMVNGWDIADFDLVYHRRWGFAPEEAVASAIYLTAKRVPFIDTELVRPGSMGKISQSWRLWQHGLPTPPTVYVPAKHIKKWLTQKNLKSYGINAPFIVKSTEGTRGKDNYLAKTITEALKIINAEKNKRFVLQQFIPNRGDYRAVVAGKKIVVTIERRAAAGSHKNNTSQGGKAEVKSEAVFPKQVKSDIIKSAQAFSRQLAGVDVVFDEKTGKHYFFEVNRAPQIEASSFPELKAAKIHEFFMELTNGKF